MNANRIIDATGRATIRVGTAMAGAIFSPDMLYRYCLWRMWDTSRTRLGGLFMNASTADESRLDPTTVRFDKLAKRLLFGAWEVVNVDALRETDSRKAAWHQFPHEHLAGVNHQHIMDTLAECSQIVVGFGVPKSKEFAARAMSICHAMEQGGRSLYCLKRTKDGWPQHPLYLSAAADPIPWSVRTVLL